MSHAIMRDAIYGSDEAVDAKITLADTDGTEIDVRALYMPSGALPKNEGIAVSTVELVANVRRTELTEKGVTELAELRGASITINSETWDIKRWDPVPYPSGEAEGEVHLVLRQ